MKGTLTPFLRSAATKIRELESTLWVLLLKHVLSTFRAKNDNYEARHEQAKNCKAVPAVELLAAGNNLRWPYKHNGVGLGQLLQC